MIETKGILEDYKGGDTSKSPATHRDGIFSLCSGGVPIRGAFGRIPGKSLRNSGSGTGGAITIYQFGKQIVVQRYTGVEIFNVVDLAPNVVDYVYDNVGNIVRDNQGIPITQ